MTRVAPAGLRRVVDNKYVLWAILSLPALWILVERFVYEAKFPYLYWSGIISCWLLILTMMITPLQLLVGPLPWLKKRRRYFGVGSFYYGMLHLMVWLVNANLGSLIRSFKRPDVLIGWIALAIMVVLTATSFDWAVRRLGPTWKTIQRWVYPAAVLTFGHWVWTAEINRMHAVYYSLPLIILSIWRIWRYRNMMRGAQ